MCVLHVRVCQVGVRLSCHATPLRTARVHVHQLVAGPERNGEVRLNGRATARAEGCVTTRVARSAQDPHLVAYRAIVHGITTSEGSECGGDDRSIRLQWTATRRDDDPFGESEGATSGRVRREEGE